MHVGYVLKKFPRISETFILNEILELTRQGAKVTIFSLHLPDDGLFHRKLCELETPVVYLPPRKSQAQLDTMRANLPLLRSACLDIGEQIELLLREERTDVWAVLRWGIEVAIEAKARGVEHLHAHFATVAAYVSRVANAITSIPFSVTCHAKDIYRDGIVPEHFQQLLAPAEFAVTVCEYNRTHILENLAGDAPIEVVTLYNGIDLELFNPRDRNPGKVPLVLGVGRLVEKKGFKYLIEAAARLLGEGEDFDCVVVGEGEERAELERQIAATGSDRIHLAGLKTQEDTRRLLAQATMLVLPCVIGSDGNRDALPTVLLEGMGCGVPSISTPVVGVGEILDGGGCGVLVPMNDAGTLAAEMRRLLHDPAERQALGARARARAEDLFDLSKNAGRLLRLFHQAGGVRT